MALPALAGAGIAAAIGQGVMWALRIYLVSIIGKVFLTLGVGLFFYTYAVPEINGWIGSKFIALPPFVRESVGASGIDKLVTMVVSAFAVQKTARIFFGKSSSN